MTQKYLFLSYGNLKSRISLDDYAQKSDLNHFILKNTDINMNDHTIENVKNSGSNDAVNKSYVDNAINSVNNLINTINLLSVQYKAKFHI